MKLWQENLQNNDYLDVKEVAAVENLLTDLNDLRQEIEDAFETVSTDSKALLAELQKSPVVMENQFLKNPEYSEEAGSHVMDIYLEVHEHHRQLGMLWEKRKARLKEYLHLCMFDQDSSQVLQKDRTITASYKGFGWVYKQRGIYIHGQGGL